MVPYVASLGVMLRAVKLRAQCFCGQFALCAAARGLFGVHQQFAFDGFGGIGAGVGEIAVF